MTNNITLTNDGTPALITIKLNNASGVAQSYPNAVITFTVASISKTTADNSIFSAPPTYTTTTDPSGPRFLIRLLPADLAQPGTYTYTLTVTI